MPARITDPAAFGLARYRRGQTDRLAASDVHFGVISLRRHIGSILIIDRTASSRVHSAGALEVVAIKRISNTIPWNGIINRMEQS